MLMKFSDYVQCFRDSKCILRAYSVPSLRNDMMYETRYDEAINTHFNTLQSRSYKGVCLKIVSDLKETLASPSFVVV